MSPFKKLGVIAVGIATASVTTLVGLGQVERNEVEAGVKQGTYKKMVCSIFPLNDVNDASVCYNKMPLQAASTNNRLMVRAVYPESRKVLPDGTTAYTLRF